MATDKPADELATLRSEADAMNEIEHGLEWSVESFVGVCLAVDNDPYRDADKAVF